MAHQYIRIPPDSTGKLLLNRVEAAINYENGTIDFAIGDKIEGESSGVYGDIINVVGTTASGRIDILINIESDNSFIGSENLQVNSVTYATFVGGSQTNYYVANTMIVGGNSPENSAYIDKYGALYTRSAEGSNLFDAFGRLQISEPITIADYVYTYDNMPNDIYEEISGTGASTYDNNIPAVTMSTESLSGDKCIRTSNLYHKYQPGISQLVEMSLWCGDSGKTNLRRRWGYFNENNGLFFELDDTTLYVVIRSKATGTIVETKIEQADWNKDTLDGDDDFENLSGYDLDVTKSNIYWIDLQWLGVGRVRFGVVINGERIICHEYYHANNYPRTYMGSPNLPVRWEIENLGNTISSSELTAICATVKSEGKYEPQSIYTTLESETVMVSGSYLTPLLSGRAKQTFKSKNNRSVGIPSDISIYNDLEPVIIYAIYDGTLIGDLWSGDVGSHSILEYDTDAVLVSGGVNIWSSMVDTNEIARINFDIPTTGPGGKLFRKADITIDPDYITLAARTISGDPTNVKIVINFEEINT